MKKKSMFQTLIVLGALALAVVSGGWTYRTADAAGLVNGTQATTTVQTVLTLQMGEDAADIDTLSLSLGATDPNLDALADALNITTSELTTTFKKADLAALRKAYNKGQITQAQYTKLSKLVASDPFNTGFRTWVSQSGIDYQTLLANALGITTKKLQTLLQKIQPVVTQPGGLPGARDGSYGSSQTPPTGGAQPPANNTQPPANNTQPPDGNQPPVNNQPPTNNQPPARNTP